MTQDLRPSGMSKTDFLTAFGGVYEHSEWIAETLFDQDLTADHDMTDGLAAALADIIEAAGEGPQLTLLKAHPDLAGKLAVSGGLTDESKSEQAGAGLDACTQEEFERFQTLNETYKSKFGFPFILAVKGWHRTQILESFETRVTNEPAIEFRTALDQVHRIAKLRISAILG